MAPSSSKPKLSTSSNVNFKYSGEGNEGTIANNVNCVVHASGSVLDVNRNTNSNLTARDSHVNMTRCTNLNARVKEGARLEISTDTNSDITLDGSLANLVSSGNTNSNIKSRDSIMKLLKNTNAEINLRDGKLTAEHNVGLTVTGFGGSVTVTGTRNHQVSRAIGDDDDMDNVNTMEFSFVRQGGGVNISFSGGVFCCTGGIFTHNSNNGLNTYTHDVKISLEYVDVASINRDRYELGIFKCQVTPLSKTEYELKINEDNLDQGSLEMLRIHPWHVIFTASKNGKKQSFDISTPPRTGNVQGTGTEGNLKINLLDKQ